MLRKTKRTYIAFQKSAKGPLPFSKIPSFSQEKFSTGIGEFDRVIGGGLVPGAFILLGGSPGVGKSTLLLQVCGQVSKAKKKVLYISAEENPSQTALRANRLHIDNPDLLFFSESSLEDILFHAKKEKPTVLIVDSHTNCLFKKFIFCSGDCLSGP